MTVAEDRPPRAENTENGDIFQLDLRLIDRLTNRYRKRALSANSKRAYQNAARDYNLFLAEHQLPVGPASLQAYFNAIAEKLKPSTLNQRKYALMKVIKAQLGGGDIFKHIAIEKAFEQVSSYQPDRRIQPEECLSEAQVQQLIDAATYKTRVIIKFLYITACRVSEMIRIRRSDCEPVNGYVKIQIIGKGDKTRFVGIPATVFSEIRHAYPGEAWLFETQNGGPLNRHCVKIQIMNAGKKLGRHVTPHALRHARATSLITNRQFSPKGVSLLLGHSSSAITLEMYCHDSISFNQMLEGDRIH